MKRIIIVILSIILLLSTTLIFINFNKYNNYQRDITAKKKVIEKVKTEYNDEVKNVEDSTKKYEELKNANKEKVEEYDKWQTEIKKINDLL